MHGEHAEQQHVAGAELRRAPLAAVPVHHLDRIVREPAGDVVAVHVHLAVRLLDPFEAVGADQQRQRSQLVRHVTEGSPAGIKVGGAAAHVDDVVVRAGVGAGADDAQPLVIIRQRLAVQEALEEAHDRRRLDQVAEGRAARKVVIAAAEAAGLTGRRGGLHRWGIGIERSLPEQHVHHLAPHLQHLLALEQASDEKVSLRRHLPVQRLHVIQDAVRLAQLTEVLSRQLHLSLPHLQNHFSLLTPPAAGTR